MKNPFAKAIACAALAGSLFAAAPEASAMPVAGLAPTVTTADIVQDVRLVCGPYRCFHRYGYGFRRFRPFYGYHRFGSPYRHRFGHRRFL